MKKGQYSRIGLFLFAPIDVLVDGQFQRRGPSAHNKKRRSKSADSVCVKNLCTFYCRPEPKEITKQIIELPRKKQFFEKNHTQVIHNFSCHVFGAGMGFGG
jgi:hypothetical protein